MCLDVCFLTHLVVLLFLLFFFLLLLLLLLVSPYVKSFMNCFACPSCASWHLSTNPWAFFPFSLSFFLSYCLLVFHSLYFSLSLFPSFLFHLARVSLYLHSFSLVYYVCTTSTTFFPPSWPFYYFFKTQGLHNEGKGTTVLVLVGKFEMV